MAVTDEELRRAAAILRAGGLVAFPTETVYGLGANALSREAVLRIYAAKGRPSTSPLIVHVASIEMVERVAAEWPEAARTLAQRFWPGPLTIIVPKTSDVPDKVTAGLKTVGVRMPAHPVARALIEMAGLPLAAPSANLFTHVSPTTAQHVRESLGDRVDMILDGGACTVGIESTVVSLASGTPVLLRPGMISRQQLEDVIGSVALANEQPREHEAHQAPGMHHRHYAPQTPLYVLNEGDPVPAGRGRVLEMPEDASVYAFVLYARLREADVQGWDWIAVKRPPDTEEWAAIRDRLKRASVRNDAC